MTDRIEADLLATPEAGRAVVRGGALRVVGYSLGVLLTVASAAVLFRHLGPGDAGRYVVVLGLVTLFGGVTDAGLSTIAIRDLSSLAGLPRDVLLRNLLGLRLVLTVLGIALALAYALVAGWDRTLVVGTLIAGLAQLLINTQGALSTELIADLRLGWVTVIDGIRQAVVAVGTIALVLLGATLLPFFGIVALAALVSLLLTWRLVRGATPLPALDRNACRTLLRDAVPFALAAAVGAIYFRLALLMVEAFASELQTGYYGASFRVVEVLLVVPQLAVQAAFPVFARAAMGDHGRLRYGLGKTLDVALLVGVLVVVGLFVGAPFIIDVIAGPRFAPAADVLQLQAPAFLGSFAAAVVGYGLLSLERNRAALAMNGAALLAMAVLGGILIPLDGARGAAVATVVCEAVLAIAGWALLSRTPTIGWLGLGVLPRLLAAAAAGILAAELSGLPSLPATLLALVITGGLALALRAVPDELIVELRAVRRRSQPAPPDRTNAPDRKV